MMKVVKKIRPHAVKFSNNYCMQVFLKCRKVFALNYYENINWICARKFDLFLNMNIVSKHEIYLIVLQRSKSA